MSGKERDRLRVLNQLEQGQLTRREAAALLEISTRQLRRILRRYEEEGDAGLVHGLRNRESNRKIEDAVRQKAIEVIRERYRDFGPTLAAEYLQEVGVRASRETVRGWMIEAGLWEPRARRVRHRQWRERKACFGELVQMDTSIHDWFEGRGEDAVLIAMIDDATSRLWARFFPTDSTQTNLAMIRSYLRRYGRPVAIYADKASHFKTTRRADLEEALQGRDAETQIARALRELGIRYIAANSPQAKGRIERSFGTAQDRLVKGMRLEGISTVEGGNEYLRKKFLPLWNRRFTVKPALEADAHRPIEGYDLNAILSAQTTRTVANDYTVRYRGQLYQIDRREITVGLRRSKVIMEERIEGQLKPRWRGRYLRCEVVTKREDAERPTPPAATPVGLRPPSVAAGVKRRIPAPGHPWRKRTVLLCRKADISNLP